MVSRLVEVLPEELDAIDGGLLAVIADGDLLPQATAALRAVYGHRVGTGAGSYEQDIVVISPREAKGLEFDGVVVLEPSMMLNHEHGTGGRSVRCHDPAHAAAAAHRRRPGAGRHRALIAEGRRPGSAAPALLPAPAALSRCAGERPILLT